MPDSNILQMLEDALQHEEISQQMATRLILTTLVGQYTKMNEIEDRLRRIESRQSMFENHLTSVEQHYQDNPSITWLLRYRTRQTIVMIIFIFIILSLWFVSDLRHFLFELAGLPADLPLPKP